MQWEVQVEHAGRRLIRRSETTVEGITFGLQLQHSPLVQNVLLMVKPLVCGIYTGLSIVC